MNELKHLAVVMDGNRRWAKINGFLEKLGYSQGLKTIQRLMEVCIDEKIPQLSLFAFSTENWARPKDEVEFIFSLLEKTLDDKLDLFIENDIRIRIIGNLSMLDKKLLDKLLYAQEKTKDCSLLCINLAISYGGKDEIVRSVKRCIEKNIEINEKNIFENLDLPLDVDLLLRVGDAKRISNFLLWQCAYAEIHFSNTLFPGLTKREFKNIIKDFYKRERRFGK
ncbi:polyprenyl diphosphate synthase [uncultured Campylobacter sp.]|uniref:polyprenyl diphosphate synthase n=1 Tax=uncultured Campylobacter sp. TaxID=218934 RepID=UPI002629E392|nr:polyprenyl diphosphate synthase [uncultured Campylobacter sp.]